MEGGWMRRGEGRERWVDERERWVDERERWVGG